MINRDMVDEREMAPEAPEAANPKDQTDDELMELTAAGEASAFEEIVKRHERRAFTIARQFLGFEEEASDIVQKAFSKILEAAKRYRGRGKFVPYLRTVVSRLCLDFAAKGRATPAESLTGVAADGSSITSKVQRRADRSAVRHALDVLPDRQRMVVVLRYYDGATYDEIADALGMSFKAVDGLLVRARRKLSGVLTTRRRRR